MKKVLISAFWILMYIVFLDLFAYDIIVQGYWNPLSWATVYMSIAGISLINVGHCIDKK